MLLASVILLVLTIKVDEAEGEYSLTKMKKELKSCFDKLKTFNIQSKPVNYSQLVEMGPLIGRDYCRVVYDVHHPYQCDYMQFLPGNILKIVLAPLSADIGFMWSVVFVMVETSTPGTYVLYQQDTGLFLRVVALLDVGSNYVINYACSIDIFQYNDFRLNSNLKNPKESQELSLLKPFVSSPSCNYFQTYQDKCPTFIFPFF